MKKNLVCLFVALCSMPAFAEDLSKALVCEQEVQQKRLEYTFYTDNVDGGWNFPKGASQSQQYKVGSSLMVVRLVTSDGKKLLKSEVGKWVVEKSQSDDPMGGERVIGFVSNNNQVKLALEKTSLRRIPAKIQMREANPLELACYWVGSPLGSF